MFLFFNDNNKIPLGILSFYREINGMKVQNERFNHMKKDVKFMVRIEDYELVTVLEWWPYFCLSCSWMDCEYEAKKT